MILRRYNRGSVVLALVIGLLVSNAWASGQNQETYEGFISGVRANAVKGEAFYHRDQAKFNLEPGLKLQEGDFIRTATNSYAELLLQPGNYLRLGPDSECQIFSDQHDKMRLKLNRGAISLEILRYDTEGSPTLYSPKITYELIRVITPNAEVFITQPGIFRINVLPGGKTELIARNGDAVINGYWIKQKRSAVISRNGVAGAEIDPKIEDSFDVWSRERADKSVNANRLLKKESPWANKRKEGQETSVEFHEDKEDKRSRRVVSAKPGAVNFFEAGVEVSRPTKEWEQLNYQWEFEAGDKLRTSKHSFAELTLLPDTYLRINSESEVLFEQLSNESILVKVVRGAAILDVARFDGKEPLPIRLVGSSTSITIVGEGNYRVDAGPSGEQFFVREGKVIFNEKAVSACRRISGGTVSACDEKRLDDFDFWSSYRGEGKFFIYRRTLTRASFLEGVRQARFRKTGFWFQNPGKTDYTFVPFTSSYFRSPYGGNYSTVLAPQVVPRNRVNLGDHNLPRLSPRPQIMRPQP